MEILNPELMWIGGRCYRVNIPNDERATVRAVNYGEEEDYDDLACELGENDFFEIETIENGSKFQLKVHISQAFHSQIIGSKGATKKRLEQETSSQITVPKINTKDTTVVIKSFSKRNVVAARNRLDLIVIAGRSKLQFTHFLSVPFTTAEIQKNYAQFKSSVLQDPDIFGIDESLFQKPEKLHLTITTLYATVVSEQLQEIANGIDDYFATRGYTHPKNDNVKLHVTLMNSLFRDNDDAVEKDLPREKDRKQQRVTFDASAILNKYKDFFFGEFEISEIHLSQRFSKASNGYYESTGILKF
jgi:activating signal cointegrator complex subunit 1